ncbi:PEP-CTERM sorting domain-containing protein [Lentisalinibacter salinarum]|uniref:PEP-CTERM sorting domain-containing protein n=1 Tax=Lentisalinibacter salinarum TaxID=2992239 RepID=UPI0038683F79
MKMRNWVAGGSSVLALCLLLSVPQVALADWVACSELGVDNHVDGQVDCLSINQNFNDEGSSPAIGTINNIFGTGDILFGGDEEWMELPVSPEGGASLVVGDENGIPIDPDLGGFQIGTFGIAASVFDMYDEVLLFWKDGQDGSTAVIIDPTGYSDVEGWVTDNVGAGLAYNAGCALGVACYFGDFRYMIPPGDSTGGAISHLNLWVRGATGVSEPGTLALLGLGLIATGFARRRKAA